MSDVSRPSETAFVLVGDQHVLYQRLVDRDGSGDLAAMYRGALVTLAHVDNPDRIAQAAHSVREMMEKLAYLDHGDDEPGSLGGHADELKTVWNGYKGNTGLSLQELAGKVIGPPLMVVLQRVDALVTWKERNRLTGRQQAQRVLEQLKVSGFTMPEDQRRDNVKGWMDLRDYFVRACHHGATDFDTFTDRLHQLERFLLNLWMPDTVGDFAEIDDLTGASNAD
jgi:hypothetical protein